jgi:alkanesulfonate monooxygenase SsuD/methylene tetrahydromethanopterin reductase-like flavin-dependent oxidoreductase (luciferase family)
MIGATQSRLLRFAAREADIIGFNSGAVEADSWTFDALRRQVDVVREAAGTRTPELHLNPDIWGIGSRKQLVEDAARRLGVSTDELDRSVYMLVGSTQQIVEYLWQLRERLGISYVTVPSDLMDEFAGVVDQLAT